MGKLGTYIMMTSILALLFYFFGLMGQDSLLGLLLNPATYNSYQLFTVIGLILAALLGATVVSYFTSGSFKIDFLMLGNMGMIGWMLTILDSFVRIITIVWIGSPVLAVLILSPLIIPFALSIIEWWRGVTT